MNILIIPHTRNNVNILLGEKVAWKQESRFEIKGDGVARAHRWGSENSGSPTINTAQTDYKLIGLWMHACLPGSLGAWRSRFPVEGLPVKLRSLKSIQ